ncbi:hypothetical protein DFH09DRAFT_1197843, partial [Mycena vulgaris]
MASSLRLAFATSPHIMFFNALIFLSALTFAHEQPQDIPPPFTVTRVFHSITDVAPFIVDATTVLTFTRVPRPKLPSPLVRLS